MTTVLIERHIKDAPIDYKPFQPFGSAVDILYAKEDEVIVDGPAGTGKSRAILEKLHLIACRYPKSRSLIVRKTRESITQSAMVTFENYVIPENGMVNWRTTEQEYRYWNGSKIVVGGLDKPSKILSTDYDIIYAQEVTEIPEEAYETLTTRARNGVVPYNQIICDCNPVSARHWAKRRMDQGKARRIKSIHKDNPVLYDHEKNEWTPRGEAYLAKLQKLTGIRKQRLYAGEWVSAEGLVYPTWCPDIHVVERFPIPEDGRKILAVDFGYTNPFVCQWWYIDGDNRMFMYREIYMTKRTVKRHSELILELSGDEYIEAVVCDHDAEDRATLEENGIITTPANKSLSTGIDGILERLGENYEDDPENNIAPTIFYLENSLVELDQSLEEEVKPVCTIEEYDDYSWSDKTNKEVPIQVNNHGLDATRYAVAYVDDYSPHGGIHV